MDFTRVKEYVYLQGRTEYAAAAADSPSFDMDKQRIDHRCRINKQTDLCVCAGESQLLVEDDEWHWCVHRLLNGREREMK